MGAEVVPMMTEEEARAHFMAGGSMGEQLRLYGKPTDGSGNTVTDEHGVPMRTKGIRMPVALIDDIAARGGEFSTYVRVAVEQRLARESGGGELVTVDPQALHRALDRALFVAMRGAAA